MKAMPTVGIEPTILCLEGIRDIHFATRALLVFLKRLPTQIHSKKGLQILIKNQNSDKFYTNCCLLDMNQDLMFHNDI